MSTADALAKAHTPKSSSTDKQSAADALRQDLENAAKAVAITLLGLAVSSMGAASAHIQDPTAKTILDTTSSFMTAIGQQIKGGSNLTRTLATGGGLSVPTTGHVSAQASLRAARSALELSGSFQARTAIPIIDAMLKLSLKANKSGLAWDVGVTLPLTSDLALNANLSSDTTRNRLAFSTLNWAAKAQGTQEKKDKAQGNVRRALGGG